MGSGLQLATDIIKHPHRSAEPCERGAWVILVDCTSPPKAGKLMVACVSIGVRKES